MWNEDRSASDLIHVQLAVAFAVQKALRDPEIRNLLAAIGAPVQPTIEQTPEIAMVFRGERRASRIPERRLAVPRARAPLGACIFTGASRERAFFAAEFRSITKSSLKGSRPRPASALRVP